MQETDRSLKTERAGETDRAARIPILYYSNFGSLNRGGQKSLWYLLRDLDRNAYEPILSCQEEGDLTSWARENGIPVEIIRLPRLRPAHIFRILACLRRFFDLIQKYGIKIVHSEELNTIVLISLLKPFLPVRTVWHVRVLWDTPFQKMISLLLVDRIICVSHAVARSFPRSKKITVAHNGIDPGEYTGEKKMFISGKFTKTDTLIGFFGSLDSNKGPHVFLETAAPVIQKYPGTLFLMVGSGTKDEKKLIRSLAAARNVLPNVIFWGEEEKNVHELMSRVDIVVLPSFTEGLSRSLLEAMALKKPIVASDIPSNAELIIPEKTGLLARKGDPADFAAKIFYLLEHPDNGREFGINAFTRVTTYFTIQSTMKHIEEVYHSFIDSKGGSLL